MRALDRLEGAGREHDVAERTQLDHEDAADLAIAAISKPYQQRDLGAALAAIDALNAGRAPDKLPGAVQLFA